MLLPDKIPAAAKILDKNMDKLVLIQTMMGIMLWVYLKIYSVYLEYQTSRFWVYQVNYSYLYFSYFPRYNMYNIRVKLATFKISHIN